MINTARGIWALLSPHERRRFILVLFGVLTAALVEVAGIASIMPFLTYVADPGALQSNQTLAWLYDALGFTSTNRFLFFLGICVLIILVIGNAVRALSTWALLRYGWMRNHTLSKRLLANYLANPYEYFLTHNTTNLGKNILMEIRQLVHGMLIPGMHSIARTFVVVFITTLLILVDPLLALTMGLALSGAYSCIYLVARRKLGRIGEERRAANQERFKVASEAFGAIKLLKLMHKERFFVQNYARASATFSSRIASSSLIGQLPRFALETIAFGGILLLVLYLLGTGKELQHVLPLIGLYAFAGYRLLPALQGIFSGITQLRFNQPILDAVQDMLRYDGRAVADLNAAVPSPLPFRSELTLEGVSFTYPAAETPEIQGIDLQIHSNTSVAFVGKTGSGKTTLAYLILGLLSPQEGRIAIDHVDLTDKMLLRWQRSLGYVPQDVFLSDCSVAQNIAFGIHAKDVDMAAVERAARIASVHDFIVDELPSGYDTVVGERGTRLSGGERQRIGIARALYHDPQILVLDEATSSLDGATEDAVIQAIKNVAQAKTLLIIAHRLSTIRDCDQVNVLDAGRIVAHGSYEELLETSPVFAEIARERG